MGIAKEMLSPLLVGVYMDGLLDELKDLGIGCYIGQHFCGAVGYADDIILLCPTSSRLMCCLMGQKANYWCITRRTLIHILK